MLVHYTAHPAIEIEPPHVSPDFIGYTMKKIQSEVPGATPIFCPGISIRADNRGKAILLRGFLTLNQQLCSHFFPLSSPNLNHLFIVELAERGIPRMVRIAVWVVAGCVIATDERPAGMVAPIGLGAVQKVAVKEDC